MTAAAVRDDTFSMSSGEPSATWAPWTARISSGQANQLNPTLLSLADNCGMKLDVECYSGHKADERPVRFTLEGTEYCVEAVLDQWYGQESIYFKVRADDGNLYILRQQTTTSDRLWDLVSFREEKNT